MNFFVCLVLCWITMASILQLMVAQRLRDVKETDIEEAFQESSETSVRNFAAAPEQGARTVNDKQADPSLNRMRDLDPQSHELERRQIVLEEASRNLQEKFDLSKDDVRLLATVPLNGDLSKSAKERCEQAKPIAKCNPYSRYRRVDGQCNNLLHPLWGSTFECSQRLLPANYSGVSDFRTSKDGTPLPLPRILSLNLNYHCNLPTKDVSHMFMFFLQLLDHDITLTPSSVTDDNKPIQCCPPKDGDHPQCAPILIPKGDPFYSEHNITCLNLVRGVICPTCRLGPRRPMNQITAFIDASFVFGSSENATRNLRANDGTGKLRVQRSRRGSILLPRSPDPQNDRCSNPAKNEFCFVAGDSRVNQHTVLTALQTLFLRDFNRICDNLKEVNPHWDGETIFQEARRILIAIVQVITYKECLPIVLGKETMTYYNLWVGQWTEYDSTKNPTMFSEFTTAAFRFGHSLINGIIANYPLNGTSGPLRLKDDFFQPFKLFSGILDPLVESATKSPAQHFDKHLVPDVTDYLYRIRGQDTGLDLASTNIQRGRDLGMPNYIDMVKYCSKGRIVIKEFRDLQKIMKRCQVKALQENYKFVQDIDLWPGILMEIPLDGAIVGPTSACIMGIQFNHLEYGDRFWVSHRDQPSSFTYQQFQELKKCTLSQRFCLNSGMTLLAENAMLQNSYENPYRSCADAKDIDYSYWKDNECASCKKLRY